VRQFFTGSRTDYCPRWSPDGKKLAFLSDRVEGGKFQIYSLDREGVEPVQLSDVQGEITYLAWSPSGMEIAFLMYDAETDDDRGRMERTGGAIEFEEHHKFARIWMIDLDTRAVKRITGDYHVWEFDWSPDGKQFAALIADEPYEWTWHIARLAVIPIGSGRAETVYSQRPKQFGGLKWSPDGNSLYFVSATCSDRGLIGGDLFRVDTSGGAKDPVNLSNDKFGSIHWIGWQSRDKLIFLSVNMTESVFTQLHTSGSDEGTFTTLSETASALMPQFQPKFSLSLNGSSMAVVREDLQTPPEVWCANIQGNSLAWKQLTQFNKPLLKWADLSAEPIEWSSFDGLKIQGFLYRPATANVRLPLIVNAHGGPSYGYGHRFDMEARFFASHGYAVLLPNPRGSMGRGVRFLEMNRGDVEGRDFKDILAGVDYCIAQGWADAEKLFLYGKSYGGYLVAWAVSQTSRFNAAVMDYGICNLLSCHGGEWNTYWEIFQFDIDPYKQPELFNQKSAIYHVHNVETPTLIMHGREDPCVPVMQAHEFFRALKELGVETKLVIYPREEHGWRERKHMIDSFQRHLDWFNRHTEKTTRN
jgi:dipeptidyl aminopeptidase/acylaminoacyl peptidase